MRRYRFLSKERVYSALNRLRAAFLAAKGGSDVDELIMGVLTHDERMRIGRRIQIANMLKQGMTYEEIKEELQVGPTTIKQVAKKIDKYSRCFELINIREDKVEKEYKRRAYSQTGGSTKIFKSRAYTGFKRKNVKR